MHALTKKYKFKCSFGYIMMLCLIIGTVLFSRSFSYINISLINIPLYITEIIIIIILGISTLTYLVIGKVKFKIPPHFKWFMILYCIVIINLIRGIYLYKDVVFSLRQSAIFYYSVFYFVVLVLFDTRMKIEKLFKLFFIAATIIAIQEIFRLFNYGIGGYNYFYCGISIICSSVYLLQSKKKNTYLIAGVLIQLVAFLKSEARCAWVGLALAIIFYLFYLRNIKLIKNSIGLTVKFIIRGIIFVTVFLMIYNPNLIKSIYQEGYSIFFMHTKDFEKEVSINTSKWRLYVWQDIIKESLEKPLFGWGFGKKFLSKKLISLNWDASNLKSDPRERFIDPHNSFLTIFHRVGLIGLMIFMLILIKHIKLSISLLNVIEDKTIIIYIIALLLSIIFILGTSFFMVVLEGPYMGIFMWILMGMIIALRNIYERDKDNLKKQTH